MVRPSYPPYAVDGVRKEFTELPRRRVGLPVGAMVGLGLMFVGSIAWTWQQGGLGIDAPAAVGNAAPASTSSADQTIALIEHAKARASLAAGVPLVQQHQVSHHQVSRRRLGQRANAPDPVAPHACRREVPL